MAKFLSIPTFVDSRGSLSVIEKNEPQNPKTPLKWKGLIFNKLLNSLKIFNEMVKMMKKKNYYNTGSFC